MRAATLLVDTSLRLRASVVAPLVGAAVDVVVLQVETAIATGLGFDDLVVARPSEKTDSVLSIILRDVSL
jgi:hypothetical protein